MPFQWQDAPRGKRDEVNSLEFLCQSHWANQNVQPIDLDVYFWHPSARIMLSPPLGFASFHCAMYPKSAGQRPR